MKRYEVKALVTYLASVEIEADNEADAVALLHAGEWAAEKQPMLVSVETVGVLKEIE